MKRRTLIHTLTLPAGSNARALAESLTRDFSVASISGSNGEHEVQLISPDELVVVISPSRACFFLEPRIEVDDDDDEHEDENEDDPHGVAEEISDYLAREAGVVQDDDDDDDYNDNDAAPDDESDKIAQQVVGRLLEEGLLELVTPRSRAGVEGYLAHRIAHGRVKRGLADALADAKGVAEVYASDEQIAAILASCQRTRTAPAPKTNESKPLLRDEAKMAIAAKLKKLATDKPTSRKVKPKATKDKK